MSIGEQFMQKGASTFLVGGEHFSRRGTLKRFLRLYAELTACLCNVG